MLENMSFLDIFDVYHVLFRNGQRRVDFHDFVF